MFIYINNKGAGKTSGKQQHQVTNIRQNSKTNNSRFINAKQDRVNR